MAKLYAPLAVAEAIQKGFQGKIPEKELGATGVSFLNDVLRWVIQDTGQGNASLDLDGFLSWVVGRTFLKRSYSGPYSNVNENMLNLIKHRKEGMSFKETKMTFREQVVYMAVMAYWDKYRQCYRFDSDFANELMQAEDVKVPVSVLTRLPFRCFYLDTEQVAQVQPSAGFFVYAGIEKETGKPNLATIRLIDPYRVEGGPETLISVLSGGDMEKYGLAAKNADGEWCIQFSFKEEFLGNVAGCAKENNRDILRHYIFMLQAMLYLSSSKPDMVQKPKRRYVYTEKRQKHKAAGPEAAVTDIGVRYGAAIRKAKETAKGTGQDMAEVMPIKDAKASKPRTSHMRKAHWHHYWVGKGRKELAVRWVPPVFVSGSGKGLQVTIHDVK